MRKKTSKPKKSVPKSRKYNGGGLVKSVKKAQTALSGRGLASRVDAAEQAAMGGKVTHRMPKNLPRQVNANAKPRKK